MSKIPDIGEITAVRIAHVANEEAKALVNIIFDLCEYVISIASVSDDNSAKNKLLAAVESTKERTKALFT